MSHVLLPAPRMAGTPRGWTSFCRKSSAASVRPNFPTAISISAHMAPEAMGPARVGGTYSAGIPGRPIHDVRFRDVTVESAATELHIAHTRGVELRNVRINGK